MNSNSRKLVFMVLLVGVCFIAYRYMIKPASENFAEQKQQLQIQMNKLSQFEKAAVVIKDWDSEIEQLEEAVKYFESKLPPTSQIHKVLEQVTLIAQKHGLATKSIRTLTNKSSTVNIGSAYSGLAQSGYIEQPLKMKLEGDFNSYYAFLLDIEKLDRITKIRKLKLTKKSKAQGYTEAECVMSIFFQS